MDRSPIANVLKFHSNGGIRWACVQYCIVQFSSLVLNFDWPGDSPLLPVYCASMCEKSHGARGIESAILYCHR